MEFSMQNQKMLCRILIISNVLSDAFHVACQPTSDATNSQEKSVLFRMKLVDCIQVNGGEVW